MTMMGQVQPKVENASLFEWVENKGQWIPEIFFRSSQHALDMHLGPNYLSYYFYNPSQLALANKHGNKTPLPDSLKHIDGHALSFQFIGAHGGYPDVEFPKPHYYNYYLSNNPKNWAHQARASNHVGIKQLYPGINLKVITEKNSFKYEFWLEPNASVQQIQIAIQGANSITSEYGDLFIETPYATLREHKPYAYQFIEGKQVQVNLKFQLIGNTISYQTGSDYNPSYPLIIDPEIVFLTYSGATADNFGCSATPGENGTMYAAGITTEPYPSIPNGKYPVTSGAFQLNYAGGGIAEGERLGEFPCDITFSKYSPDGSTLLYATYLGGSNNEIPHSLFVDDSANLIVMGNTYSNNFPVTNGAFDTSHNGRHDIIVAKFKSNGAMYASTYLGGSFNDGINFTYGVTNRFFADSYRGDVITDSVGNIIVATVTQSSNFPTSANAIQSTLKGFQDGLVFKLNAGLNKLLWSTYLGGDSVDALYSIDIGTNAEIYVSGGTNSANFPKTAGHYQATYGGGATDGIVAILDYEGKNILAATYFGTAFYDQIYNLEIDKDNQIYVVGQSLGNIPVTAGLYSVPNSHQFLACFSPNLNSKVWSTVFGSGRSNIDVTINAFLVDECNRIYVSSWGGAAAQTGGTSTQKLPVTADAFQKVTDGSDFYLMLLNKNASGLLYATFVGGDNPDSDGDHVDGGTSRFDKKGVVYQSMCASCPRGLSSFSDLATTPGVYAPLNLSPRCSNAALKFDFRIKNARFTSTADTCASEFTFDNLTQNASNFMWVFPDGDTTYQKNPKKQIPSKYYGDTIIMIAEFGTNCADTAFGFVYLPDSLDKLEVPNVFTPNNDGLNDVFEIKGVSSQCNETSVYIYNRWGQLYYQNNVSYFQWDGKDIKGIEAPEGVYFYMLKTKKLNTGKEDELHGTLTLIR
jgi:gliding motility-associated-like protein